MLTFLSQYCLILLFGILSSLAFPGVGAASPKSRELIHQGVADSKEGKSDEALKKFEAASQADPKDAEALFFQGATLNRLRRFKEAQERLEKAKALGSKHPDLAFETGWSLLRLGRWKEAVTELESYEKARPGRGLTSESLGRAYLALGELDKAEAKLKEALERDPNLKRTVLFDLAAVERRRKQEKPWHITLSTSGGHNSNVIELGDGRPQPRDVSKKSSGFGRFTLGGSYDLRPTREDTLTLGYGLETDLYSGISKFNLFESMGLANYRHVFSRDLAGEIVTIDRFTQLHGQNFKNQWALRPALAYRLTDWSAAELGYTAAVDKYYFSAVRATGVKSRDRDALSHTLSLTPYFRVPGTELSGRMGYFHVWNQADGSDWDFKSNGLVAGLSHPLFWQIRGDVSYVRTFDRYDKRNSYSLLFFPSAFPRKDDVDYVTVQLVRPIYDWLSAYARFEHTNNQSNIQGFNYKQRIINIGFVAQF